MTYKKHKISIPFETQNYILYIKNIEIIKTFERIDIYANC